MKIHRYWRVIIGTGTNQRYEDYPDEVSANNRRDQLKYGKIYVPAFVSEEEIETETT